jgi:hypothetical protein
MSDYKIVNGKRVRVCKYECGQTVAYDEENKYMIEVDNDNVHHTPKRCKAFKEINQDPNKKKAVETIKEIENTTNNQNHNSRQITLEMVTKKLESIGIIINLERLMSQK